MLTRFGGGGVWEMLTMADKGGGEVWTPPFLADIICEQSLKDLSTIKFLVIGSYVFIISPSPKGHRTIMILVCVPMGVYLNL